MRSQLNNIHKCEEILKSIYNTIYSDVKYVYRGEIWTFESKRAGQLSVYEYVKGDITCFYCGKLLSVKNEVTIE